MGLTDLIPFLGLGLLFWKTGVAKKIGANGRIEVLVRSVVVASFGLVVWYAFSKLTMAI